MLKVKVNNKSLIIDHPNSGRTSFDKEALKGLKKAEFDKMYKGKFDTKEYWIALRKYTK